MASDGGSQAQFVNTQLSTELVEESSRIVRNTLREKFDAVTEYLQTVYG